MRLQTASRMPSPTAGATPPGVIKPLPDDLRRPDSIPDAVRRPVPAAWRAGGVFTMSYAAGTSPYRDYGVTAGTFPMTTMPPTPGARVEWVEMNTSFDDALAAAAALVLDDSRATGYGTTHAIFQAAQGGAYFIAPLRWVKQSTSPDIQITLDSDGTGDLLRLPDAVSARTPDLKAVVGAGSWVDLR